MSIFSLLLEMQSLFYKVVFLWISGNSSSLCVYEYVKDDFEPALGRAGLHTAHTEGLRSHLEAVSEISSSLSSLPNLFTIFF